MKKLPNLMRNTAPQSGEELAAQMLANGSIKLLQDDYRRETLEDVYLNPVRCLDCLPGKIKVAYR